MITYEEALEIVRRQAWPLETEATPLREALGRVLAQDVFADMDIPPFNKSAMDGYACRREDLGETLEVVEILPAGRAPSHVLGPGQCAKIMTGAPVPGDADCVVMVEHTEETADGRIRVLYKGDRANICARGEDVRAGDRVLASGARLRPQQLAILASAGCGRPCVTRRPRVGVLATGSELAELEQTPAPGQIRNSNSYQVAAQAALAGAEVTDYGVVPDEDDALTEAQGRAIADNDVVISTGGVSAGDYDLVPGLLGRLGLTVHFRHVAIQPGKPLTFATGASRAYFGLSGNPVSSFLQFELFVRPFLDRLQCDRTGARELRLPAGRRIERKNAARMGWLPVTIEAGAAIPVAFHGSAHIHALGVADGLLAIPAEVHTIEENGLAAVRLIR